MSGRIKDAVINIGRTGTLVSSAPFFIISELFSCFFIIAAGKEVEGAIVFLLLLMLQLFFCDEIFPSFRTLMFACVFLTKCYDSFDTFIQYKLFALPLAVSVIFHFAAYRKPVRTGP